MRRVIIESPLAGELKRNIRYARLCMIDCLRRGETPYASHLLITQVWDDMDLELRDAGIRAGHAWYPGAELCAVYDDFGISSGMKRGIAVAIESGVRVEYRSMPDDLLERLDLSDSFAATDGASF